MIDGEEKESVIERLDEKLSDLLGFEEKDSIWQSESKIAPFDQEVNSWHFKL